MTKYFPLLKHKDVRLILPSIYEVVGTMKLFRIFRYSRNMHIIISDDGVVLINPVRVDDKTIKSIQKLGDIKHIYKIGQLHSVDIPFYMDRFKPKLWKSKKDPTMVNYAADEFFEDYDVLPHCGSMVYIFPDTKLAEVCLVHPSGGGTLISCDAFVNMGVDPMANWFTSLLNRLLPDPTYVGPNWVRFAKPTKEGLLGVLEIDFKNLVTAHGRPLLGDARLKLTSFLDNYFVKK